MPRYIDADELLNRLPNDLPYKASVKRVLIQAPTADVVPKSEGEWIKDERSKFVHRYHCSVCNFFLIGEPTKYCEDCGAKMKYTEGEECKT